MYRCSHCNSDNVVATVINEAGVLHCNNCGYKSHILNWLCPSCNSWECIAPRSTIDIIEDGKTNESN